MLRRTGTYLATACGLALVTAAVAVGRSAPTAAAAPLRAANPAKFEKSGRERKVSPALPSESARDEAFARLRPLRFLCPNARQAVNLRLYDDHGFVDENSARELDSLLADHRDPDHVQSIALDRRTLQLVYRAAYHFRVDQVEVVSAYRAPGRRREGPHGRGRAIDFKLKGVTAAALAAYLRTLPRVGVGVYTHRRTQYVHLDVREQSYHWLDASPPGRTWRELRLPDSKRATRDARYTPESDWPEGSRPPRTAIWRSEPAPHSDEGSDEHG
ncbi:MAG TPA: DUF882 domain-containing protein [Polyangiaceae bacterium]|nr:DUF882 domain-containing protein [Polyangiaceae bacterium]